MNKSTRNFVVVLTGCLMVAGASLVQSQLPAPGTEVESAPVPPPIVLQAVDASAPAGPIAALRALKANNALILERQAQQLSKLEELHKAAEQVRIWARRS